MISGLSKFTSVRHIVSVSTLDLVADEENLRKLNEKGLQATEKRSRRKSRDKSPGRKKRVTSLLEEGDYPSLRIDNPSITSDFTLKRDLYEDGYGLKFCNQPHINLIVNELRGKHSVLSILTNPEIPEVSDDDKLGISWLSEGKQTHIALWTTSKGYKEFDLCLPSFVATLPQNDLYHCILDQLRHVHGYRVNCRIWEHEKFVEEFKTLEVKHPQKRKEMKVAVLYVKKHQQRPHEWALNGHDGDKLQKRFWKFMEEMGHKIDLTTWTGYRGDMGKKGTTYYDHWDPEDGMGKVDVIYHVSSMLNAEEHRRLIGNDIAVIIYVEEGATFSPKYLLELGTVQQVYLVVRPEGSKLWSLSTFSNINIKEYYPIPPENPVDLQLLKKYILTKVYNGLTMTQYCPPMNRLFFVPREFTLESIIEKYLHKYDHMGVKLEGKWIQDSEISQNYEKILEKEGLPASVAKIYSLRKASDITFAHVLKKREEEKEKDSEKERVPSPGPHSGITINEISESDFELVPKTHYVNILINNKTIELLCNDKQHLLDSEIFGPHVLYKCKVDSRGQLCFSFQGKAKGVECWRVEEVWGLSSELSGDGTPINVAKQAIKTGNREGEEEEEEEEDQLRVKRTVTVMIKKEKEEGSTSDADFCKKFEIEFKRGFDKKKRFQKRSLSVGGKKESYSQLFYSQKNSGTNSLASPKERTGRVRSPSTGPIPNLALAIHDAMSPASSNSTSPTTSTSTPKANKPRLKLSLPSGGGSEKEGNSPKMSPRNLFK